MIAIYVCLFNEAMFIMFGWYHLRCSNIDIIAAPFNANSCVLLQFSSALLEQSRKSHVDQMESLKNIISKLETSVADKQAENTELKSSVKIQKQKSKKLLEQVTILLTPCKSYH